jgi:hypothetical protein
MDSITPTRPGAAGSGSAAAGTAANEWPRFHVADTPEGLGQSFTLDVAAKPGPVASQRTQPRSMPLMSGFRATDGCTETHESSLNLSVSPRNMSLANDSLDITPPASKRARPAEGDSGTQDAAAGAARLNLSGLPSVFQVAAERVRRGSVVCTSRAAGSRASAHSRSRRCTRRSPPRPPRCAHRGAWCISMARHACLLFPHRV